jgi:hypothetical protein
VPPTECGTALTDQVKELWCALAEETVTGLPAQTRGRTIGILKTDRQIPVFALEPVSGGTAGWGWRCWHPLTSMHCRAQRDDAARCLSVLLSDNR